jgi:acetyltransferase
MARYESIAGATPAARSLALKDGRRVAVRAACSRDIPAVPQFVRGLSERSRRNRFFAPVRELSPDQLERVTRSRPPGELALVAEATDDVGSRIVAMAQYVVCDTLDAEFAVVVDDTWHRQGLGMELVTLLTHHATRAGLPGFCGFVLPDNWPMLCLLARLDCELVSDSDPYLIRAFKRFDTARSRANA